MKFTHEELLQAVREAGRGRESFTCADVRKQLRVSTKDRRKLSQFHHSFRSFQKLALDDIEKLGSNSYRLREQVSLEPVELASPVEVAAPIKVTSRINVASPLVLESLVQLESPVQLETPAQLASPVQLASQVALELASPVVLASLSDLAPFAERELPFELELPIELELHEESLAAFELDPPTQPLVVFESQVDPQAQPTAAVASADVHTAFTPSVSSASTDVIRAATSNEAQPSARGWRDRAHWLGRRMAQLFGGAGVDAGTAA